MKGNAKDCLSLQYERLMNKNFGIISQATHSSFPVLAESHILTAFTLYYEISHI